jgi:signal transduction histidine kinase/HAMP domain-containing protein
MAVTASEPRAAALRGLPRVRVSMRWWLALAFGLVAAVTAIAVGRVYLDRSEAALNARARDIAVGRSVAAVSAVARAVRASRPPGEVLRAEARRRGLVLFAYSADGRLVGPATSAGILASEVPSGDEAVATALRGDRFVASTDHGGTVVGLRVRSPSVRAVVAYVARPDEPAELSIVRDATIIATLVATALGLAVGAGLAMLVAARLRRITNAAAQIAGGRFDRPLSARFPDEVGALAVGVDSMRERLRASFTELESERAKLSRLLERLHEGVVAVDRRLTVRVANPVAGEMLGEALQEGGPLPDPWSPPRLHELAKRLFEPGAEVEGWRVETDDAHVFQVVGLPPRGRDETAVLVITDLSAEARREGAQREFVANAAHELRTPLTTIIGAVDVLRAGAAEDPEARGRFLGHIYREAGRLARLTRALLVLARAQGREEPPRRDAVPLRPLLQEIAAGIEPRPGVRLEVRCGAEVRVLADRDLVEQALVNLLANAARHTAAGRIRLGARLDGGRVVIAVADTGPGMARGERDRAFERFYRGEGRDSDGFGLGLAIVRQAVEAMGGAVDVRSAPGRGTTATIALPPAGAPR